MDVIANILQAAGREVFDSDPCSPSHTGPVPALTRWIEADDGLRKPWSGLVFCNPPYGRMLAPWVAHCATQGAQGAVVIALIPARPDTKSWHTHIIGQAAVIMLRGCLRFGDGRGSAPFPSALVVWGNATLAAQLAHHLPGSWYIPRS
ncbi:MAG: DNA N-6-adenine-methyltransferase [Acidiferrobacter sp.]